MFRKSIIEEIYRTMTQENRTSPEYAKQQRKNIILRENFEKTLTEQQKKQLDILIENRLVTESIISKEIFIKGFKIAIRIITEALSKEDI